MLSKGVPIARAARVLKCDRRTVSEWISRGRADLAVGVKSPYAKLVEDIDAAQSQQAVRAAELMEEHMKHDWRAVIAWSKLRMPEDFGGASGERPLGDDPEERSVANLELLTDAELEAVEHLYDQIDAIIAHARARGSS